MNKILYYFILIIISNLVSYAEYVKPNIIWEKFFTSEYHNKLNNQELISFTDDIYLIYEGTKSDNVYYPGLISINYDGDVNFNCDFLKQKNCSIKFIDKQNRMYYGSIWDGYSRSGIAAFKTDASNNIIQEYKDTILQKTYSSLSPVFFNDSIFQYNSGKNGNMEIDVYDKYVNYTRTFILDISSIEDSLFGMPYLLTISQKSKLIVRLREQKFLYDFISCFDMNGNLLWATKIYDKNFVKTNIAKVVETPDGDFLGSGYVSTDNSYSIILFKLNNNGKLLWKKIHEIEKKIKFTGYLHLLCNGKYIAIYGKYYQQNIEGSQFWLRFFDAQGEALDKYIWNYNNDNWICGITEKNNGNLLVYGRNGWDSLYLAEIAPQYTSIHKNSEIHEEDITISPNPSSDYLNISIDNNQIIASTMDCDVINSIGNSIDKFEINQPGTFHLQTDKYPTGIYFLKFTYSTKNSKDITFDTKKIIINR